MGGVGAALVRVLFQPGGPADFWRRAAADPRRPSFVRRRTRLHRLRLGFHDHVRVPHRRVFALLARRAQAHPRPRPRTRLAGRRLPAWGPRRRLARFRRPRSPRRLAGRLEPDHDDQPHELFPLLEGRDGNHGCAKIRPHRQHRLRRRRAGRALWSRALRRQQERHARLLLVAIRTKSRRSGTKRIAAPTFAAAPFS